MKIEMIDESEYESAPLVVPLLVLLRQVHSQRSITLRSLFKLEALTITILEVYRFGQSYCRPVSPCLDSVT